MLILSRKCGQRVVVSFNGEAVTIEILKVKGDQVRVGVEAPKHIAVHREEVWGKIIAEQVAQQLLPVAG